MDKLTIEQRSLNMSKIRGANTRPEMLVRKYLTRKGYRYRINTKLKGKPDIVFVSKKIAVFVHGCFWHVHNCQESHIPKSNTSYWSEKLANNVRRDKYNLDILETQGWKVFVLWECDIEKDIVKAANKLLKIIRKTTIV